MAINFSCPISGEQRDNNVVRVVAGVVFVISIIALALGIKGSTQIAAIMTGLLAVDFIIRGFFKSRYSPIATLARGIVSGLNLPKKMVDSAPKVFAARIGVAFTVASTILLIVNLTTAGLVVLAILILCAGLESIFSFCLGCFVYSLLPKKVGNLLARDFWK